MVVFKGRFICEMSSYLNFVLFSPKDISQAPTKITIFLNFNSLQNSILKLVYIESRMIQSTDQQITHYKFKSDYWLYSTPSQPSNHITCFKYLF